ncbi:hypothetical protein HK097_002319 [Rhizophlyctis rosea]|uniref:Uncharacterized protein n=1 Tax=Rhizophlyctis rosea TaxID=64517 RepID=A0AAD5SMH7_9FUNG|nr:hypothetical protein HK097_002319 [Rhizophlyctis rosea]
MITSKTSSSLLRKTTLLILLTSTLLTPTLAAHEDLLLTPSQQYEYEYSTSRIIPKTDLSKSQRQVILSHYAPHILLHPRDQWRPADPQAVYEASPRLKKHDLEGLRMQGMADPEDEREDKHGLIGGTLNVPIELQHGNEVRDDAEVRAKLTAQVVQYGFGNRTYLQYWTYFPVNGCQGFRTGLYDGLRTFVRERQENFEWCNMAYHNGDWEHITIQLSSIWDGSPTSIPPISKIFLSAHADGQWLPPSSLSFTGKTHPIIYAALNSHANYAQTGTHKNEDKAFNFVSRITPALTLGAVQRIMLADVCDLESDLYTYDVPDGNWGRFVSWRTWEEQKAGEGGDGGIWDLTKREEWPGFAFFRGRWGMPVDQTRFLAPPEGVSARSQLYGALRTAQRLGVLKKFVHPYERAPKGPRQHKNWYNLDRPFDPR